jgi:hypothetical protein
MANKIKDTLLGLWLWFVAVACAALGFAAVVIWICSIILFVTSKLKGG